MKPLPSAPLTDEDFDIYVRMCAHDRRAKGKHRLSWAHWYDVADRRDAELMFRAQTVVTNRQGPLWLAFDAIAGTTDWEFGGCDVSGRRPGTMQT